MSYHLNLVRIKAIFHALGELRDAVAFVGGATVALYADRPDQTDIRPTEDVDVLIEIASYNEYNQIIQKLSSLGFSVDKESKVICRYKYQGLTVDVMPTEEGVLGFSNKWYKKGFENSVKYSIDQQTVVNIFSASYFVACKMEAFKGRGKSDGRTSHDFEDIVFILDNRKAIWQEFRKTDVLLKRYLIDEFSVLLSYPFLEEWISVHLEYATATARANLIIKSMRTFVIE